MSVSLPRRFAGPPSKLPVDLNSKLLRYFSSIKSNENHELFRQLGENRKLQGVQRLAQQLQQESVLAIGKGRSDPTEEESKSARGFCKERKAGITER